MTNQSFGSRYLTGNEVRRAFIDFFVARGHREMASSSLVPHNDPTVLLTTAGMQQMTPYFLGLETPPAVRLCSVQKCFRTDDIDEVGDESHNTFFFMLGNFSVGDYFKKQSLAWTWEFFTEVMGLPAERLYPTVHPSDDEAYRIWRDEIGVPEERIGKLEDNWWGPVGPTGPNGPDSEVYFDRGEEHGCGRPECAPGCDCERYLETWNNVFMEFFQAADGTRTPLPRKNVDTGMGLERLVLLMQRANSNFDTDLFQDIIQRAANLAHTTYGVDEEHDRALRVIADHIRGATFLISDGVLPGNEGRSYILRRIVRRAVRHGRKLGLDRPFLKEMADVVIEQFGEDYPELRQRRGQIERVLTHEEESFGRTLNTGMSRFQALIKDLRQPVQAVYDTVDWATDPAREAVRTAHEAMRPTQEAVTLAQEFAEIVTERVEPLVLPGIEAFRLHDTYGFPFDLTVELAREHGISVDQTGFNAAMEAQRAASRGGAVFKDTARGRAELYVSLAGQRTAFLGYDQTTAEATILALVGPDGALDEAEAGQAVEVILDQTPFYGESGGQIGDTGHIRTETGVVEVEDTFKPTPDLVVQRGIVAEGFVRTGEKAHAEIDAARRQAIRRNHTATHLLHRALRIVLGDETHQAGSLVAPDRLRFDFTSLDPMRPDQIQRVAEIVNHQIMTNREVTATEKPYKEAVADGAMALFGEKYGDVVRVVAVPGFSQELCGGTHVGYTGEIGPFLVVSEGSVAAGIRRIEALTGEGAVERMLSQQRVLEGVARELRVPWSDVPAQIDAAQDRSRAAEREVERLRGQLVGSRVADLVDRAVAVDGTRVLSVRVEVESKDGLRQMGDRLRDHLNSGVIVLGAVVDGRPSLLSMVTPDVIQRGVRAGDLVREAAAIIDGRGGGRPELAEAGGKDATKLDDALSAVAGIVKEALGVRN